MRSNERLRKRYFDELQRELLAGLVKGGTLAQRRKAVKYFIEFLNTYSINLKSLNSIHIRDFIQYLSEKKTYRGGKFAWVTIKQIYALVKSFYVRCYEESSTLKHFDRIFTKNMLHRYKLSEHKLPKYIDQEKMQKLLAECPERWKALLHFMYDTGARISEVLNVQRQHLDLDRKIVRIYEPKTMNVRVTTLSNTTSQLLKIYFTKHRPNPNEKHRSFVFINQQHRKMSPRAVQYIVKKISSKILGEQNAITPHYFRAACAVHLLEGGVDIRQVQEIIGWKSLSVAQNYTRVTPQRQALLKEQHHPGFRSQILDKPMQEKKLSAIPNLAEDSFQRQILETQHKHQQDMDELKQRLQQESKERKQERQDYERRIDELLKSQQQLNDLLKSQQQLIQSLTQKST